MPTDPTDDPADENYVNPGPGASTRRRQSGIWTPAFLGRFTAALRKHPAVLPQLPGNLSESREEVIYALQSMGRQLECTLPELHRYLTLFRKEAFNKMCSVLKRAVPGAETTDAEALRLAPPWLRDLEPHLKVLPRARAHVFAKSKAPKRALTCAPGDVQIGASLAAALTDSAWAQRTLDARAVCARVTAVSPDKREQLQFVWWRMLDVVREKLALQREGQAGMASHGRMTADEAALADLLVLLDESLGTLGNSGNSEMAFCSTALYNLARIHRLEEAEDVSRWRDALRDYRTGYCDPFERFSSVLLLQRRWHELKQEARRALLACRTSSGPSAVALSSLHSAMLGSYPQVATRPLPTWRELVQAGRVYEDTHDVWYHNKERSAVK